MAADQRVLEIIIRAKNEATKALQSAGKDLGAFGKIGAAGAGITAMGVGAAMALDGAANKAIAYGKEVIAVQRMTGATAEESSKWAAVLGRVGIDQNGVGKIIKTVTKDMQNAKGVLVSNGIAVKDSSGNYRSYNDILGDSAEKYKGMSSQAERNAFAQKLFGKQWKDMTPILAGGKAKISELTEEAKRNGKILGQDSVDQLMKYNKQLKANTEAEEGLKIQAGLAVLPIKTLIIETIGKGIAYFTNLSPAMKKTIMAVVLFGTAAALVVGPLLMVIGFLPAIVSGVGLVAGAFSAEGIAAGIAWLATLGPIALIIAAIALVAAGVYLVIKHWDVIGPFFKKMWAGVTKFFAGFWDGTKAFVAKWGVEILAVLVPFIGVPLLLKKHWNKIGPFLGQAWATAKGFVKKWGPEILAVLVPFIGIPLLIRKHWDKIGPFISGALGKAKTIIGTFITNARQWGANLIQGFVTGLLSKIGAVGDAVRQIAGKIAGFLGFSSPSKEGPGTTAHKWAPNLIGMYAAGLLDGLPNIRSSVSALAGALNPGVSPAFAFAGAPGRGVSSGGFSGTIEIPVLLDGKEVGRGLARVSNTSGRSGTH